MSASEAFSVKNGRQKSGGERTCGSAPQGRAFWTMGRGRANADSPRDLRNPGSHGTFSRVGTEPTLCETKPKTSTPEGFDRMRLDAGHRFHRPPLLGSSARSCTIM